MTLKVDTRRGHTREVGGSFQHKQYQTDSKHTDSKHTDGKHTDSKNTEAGNTNNRQKRHTLDTPFVQTR